MDDKKLITLSYSLLSSFRDCRKLVYWQYVRRLASMERTSNALEFGTLVHNCLETWHGTYDFAKVDEVLNEYGKNREEDTILKNNYLVAKAMMEGYTAAYSNDKEDFEVVSLEKKFFAPIQDMDTLQPIPGVQMTCKVDGIVKVGAEYFLLEHKTAGKMDGNYLNKLWSDFQITLYCYYVNKVLGIPCSGIYYNILVKPKIEQDRGETEEEFKLRCREACKKNKSGKTNIKRKEPESDSDFQLRLKETFSDKRMFHRETIYVSKGLMKRTVSEISELTKAFLSCIKRERFYLNTNHCFRYGVACPYFPICSNNDNPNIIENMFEQRPNAITLDMVDYDGPLI